MDIQNTSEADSYGFHAELSAGEEVKDEKDKQTGNKNAETSAEKSGEEKGENKE